MKPREIFLFLSFMLIPYSLSASELRNFDIHILGSEVILRNKDDKYYSFIVCNIKGWNEFTTNYNIQKDYPVPNFSQYILIVGLNDTITEKLTGYVHNETTKDYFLDYADSGVRFKLQRAPEGTKRSKVTIIKAKQRCNISHVGVRTMAAGLSGRFD